MFNPKTGGFCMVFPNLANESCKLLSSNQTQRGKSSIQFDDFSSWPCCILGDFQAMFDQWRVRRKHYHLDQMSFILFLNTRYNLDDPWRMVRAWLDIDLFYRYIRIPLGPSNLAESSQRSVIKARYRKRVQSQILIGIGPEEIADLGHMNGSWNIHTVCVQTFDTFGGCRLAGLDLSRKLPYWTTGEVWYGPTFIVSWCFLCNPQNPQYGYASKLYLLYNYIII